MVASTKSSLIMASLCCLVLLSSIHTWKSLLASTSHHTLLGGLLGSLLFTFTLTVIGNLESLYFGKYYTMGIFPEILLALLLAVSAATSIHRVAGTSCFLLSMLALYYINDYSQKYYEAPTVQVVLTTKKKKNL
ncbi:keratinocyte-associated protein 2-like [Anthonomus grandis grandis]|uniref:keratinocyte-associated protein 2-like n=1 Tax=Anthonomus grandis grandis TaxID=2921223 RepID=UPI002165C467|nr:keratinocyte-associated protein 2-like [Anthonomus grandis grandis]